MLHTIENVKTFKYLGSMLTNQNSIHEGIKCRFKAENSSYYSVQTLLSSRLLSKNLKINIYQTIILPVMLYGCETWSLTLREQCRLNMFQSRILKQILGLREIQMGSGESCKTTHFIVLTVHLIYSE